MINRMIRDISLSDIYFLIDERGKAQRKRGFTSVMRVDSFLLPYFCTEQHADLVLHFVLYYRTLIIPVM